jgi:hypothetical protein
MRHVGFDVATTSTTFPIDMFLLMGDNYTVDGQLGRQCHAKRKQFEINLKRAGLNKMRNMLYERLIKVGIGREIVMYGVKN